MVGVLFLISSLLCTNAFSQEKDTNKDRFLTYRNQIESRLVDPDEPTLAQVVQEISPSIAALANDNGRFWAEVHASFLDTKIEQNGEQITVQKFLEKLDVRTATLSRTKFLLLQPGQELILKALVDSSVALESRVFWRRYEVRSPKVDGRFLAGFGKCTGFRVGSKYLMTNFHCMNSKFRCAQSSAHFNEELDASTGKIKKHANYSCQKVVLADKDMDFSVVEYGGDISRYPALTLSSAEPEISNESVFTIGHPAEYKNYGLLASSLKKASGFCHVTENTTWKNFQTDYLSTAVAPFIPDFRSLFSVTEPRLVLKNDFTPSFSIDCPTMGGFSGSPVINEKKQVLGIVHRARREWIGDPSIKPETLVVPMREIILKYGKELKELGIIPSNLPI